MREPNPQPSEKHLEVLRFIIGFVEQHGYQPSRLEIAEQFGVTRSAINQRLKQLADRGVIGPLGAEKERAVDLKNVRFKAVHSKD